MAYFNQTLYDDIRVTVYEFFQFLRNYGNAGMNEIQVITDTFAHSRHEFAAKINKDIVVQWLNEEYDGISLTEPIQLILNRARANTPQLRNYARVDDVSIVRYRLYVNAHPLHFKQLVGEINALLEHWKKRCYNCDAPMKYFGTCSSCKQRIQVELESYESHRPCPNCGRNIYTRELFCQRGHHCNNPIAWKTHYFLPEFENNERAMQELLRTNKLVYYFDNKIYDAKLFAAHLRRLSPHFFGKSVPRFTKAIAKGIGFATQPLAGQTGELFGGSVGSVFSKIDWEFFHELNALLARDARRDPEELWASYGGGHSDNVHINAKNNYADFIHKKELERYGNAKYLDYITWQIYKKVEPYARYIYQPFE